MNREAWLYDEQRLRAGWRIVIFLALYAALVIAAQIGVAAFRGPALQWVQLAVLLGCALIASAIVLSRLEGRGAGALGFHLGRGALREAAIGTGFGAVLIAAAAAMLLASGAAYFVDDGGTVAAYLATLGSTFAFFWLAAAWEEALFRGYPFQALVEGIGAWPATLLASGGFALVHAGNPNVTRLALANIFIAGIMLSVAYLRTRSLWFATGVHVGWNWTMATLFDFPVSGLLFETPLYSTVVRGADLWTGGDFGPEAGLVGTIVLLPAIAVLLRARAFAPSAEILAHRPIVDRRLGPEWGRADERTAGGGTGTRVRSER